MKPYSYNGMVYTLPILMLIYLVTDHISCESLQVISKYIPSSGFRILRQTENTIRVAILYLVRAIVYLKINFNPKFMLN